MPKIKQEIGIQPDAALRRLVTEVIRHCPKKRSQIADELTERLGLRVTVHMLNDFTSEGKKAARFPALFVSAFCEVVSNDRLQRAILSPRLRELLELGEVVARLIEERYIIRRGRPR